MLRHRLVFGVIMAALMVGVLVVDDLIGKPYPFLLLVILLVGGLATRELLALLPAEERPRSNLTVLGVMGILLANWWPMVREATSSVVPEFVSTSQPCVCIFFVVFLAAFLWEMAVYKGPGGAIRRIAWTLFITSYIGLLPSSLVQIRFLPGLPSTLVLAAAIAIPKVCDIGAYTFGRLFGRTPFTPILSPKKTWEGFAGGMSTAVGVSILFHSFGPVFRLGLPHAIVFGLAVGLAGVLGDLAESMIKREVAAKDASSSIPGFGGILDVIDSVIFAAPVAYLILSV